MSLSLQNYWHIQISEVKDEGRRVGTVKGEALYFAFFLGNKKHAKYRHLLKKKHAEIIFKIFADIRMPKIFLQNIHF